MLSLQNHSVLLGGFNLLGNFTATDLSDDCHVQTFLVFIIGAGFR